MDQTCELNSLSLQELIELISLLVLYHLTRFDEAQKQHSEATTLHQQKAMLDKESIK